MLHRRRHHDLAQMGAVGKGIALLDVGLAIEADVGQLVAIVAEAGIDDFQRRGELYLPEA